MEKSRGGEYEEDKRKKEREKERESAMDRRE
jgi:hypothetical protein